MRNNVIEVQLSNFEPKCVPVRPRTTRVDIDATGRRALDLGPSWVLASANWQASDNLHITMARRPDGQWDSLRCSCVVEPADFVHEDVL